MDHRFSWALPNHHSYNTSTYLFNHLCAVT